MKKLVLMLIALFFSHAVMAQGVTTKVTNKTKCDVTVTMKCYDLCIVVGTKTMVISAGATSVPMTVTPCGPGNFIIFTVCWNIDPHICQNQPPIPCTSVDGSAPPAPSPCSPGTYTDKIQYCKDCAPLTNGFAQVKYDPIMNELTITP
jgi:hypothetical protein